MCGRPRSAFCIRLEVRASLPAGALHLAGHILGLGIHCHLNSCLSICSGLFSSLLFYLLLLPSQSHLFFGSLLNQPNTKDSFQFLQIWKEIS